MGSRASLFVLTSGFNQENIQSNKHLLAWRMMLVVSKFPYHRGGEGEYYLSETLNGTLFNIATSAKRMAEGKLCRKGFGHISDEKLNTSQPCAFFSPGN